MTNELRSNWGASVKSVRVTDPAQAVREQCTRQARLTLDQRRKLAEFYKLQARGEGIVEGMARRENRTRDRETTQARARKARERARTYAAAERRVLRENAMHAQLAKCGNMAWLASE